MTSIPSDQPTTGKIYAGPLNGEDPLTESELALLLAIPHWAEKAPDVTMFRLPLGPDPTQGWVDATFGESRSIIARLAVDWKTRLSNVVSLSMDDDTIALYLNKSGCQIAVHSGISDAQLEGIRSSWKGTMIRLTEDEHAHQIALNHKQGQTDSTIPWPEPRRPDPALIIHSSGSTGSAKLLPLSSYFITLGLPSPKKLEASQNDILTPDPRPILVFSPPYWASFNAALINRLATGHPTAFAHVKDIAKVSSSQFIDWPRSLGAGGSVSAPRFIRDVLVSGSESSIKLLQGMDNIAVGGSVLDESTAALAEKYKLKLINLFGATELGTMMLTTQPPFTHLRLLPGIFPLILPISGTEPDGSRQVQLWFSPSTSPRVAHLRAKGTIPLKFEPFPGEGPHKGELAVRLDDIFKEVTIGTRVSYVYLGRSDDLIKLAGRGGWDINASTYETELTSEITSYLASQNNETAAWTVEGIQLFGNNRPCTALVIQLCPVDHDQHEIGQDLLECLYNLVKLVNNKLELEPNRRVHPQKRMLVVTSHGKAYGSGAGSFGEDIPRLLVTHKHTLQRWKNVEAFTSWMDGLDYSEP
ncbi:hypothetical protein OPQ81_007406 [Rhizoctonia solani]|nr:hypothetical protein OPQ81_007406 [Rhizoctonia solani]